MEYLMGKTLSERIAQLAGECLDEMEKRDTGECPKCKRRRERDKESKQRKRDKVKKEREYGHFG